VTAAHATARPAAAAITLKRHEMNVLLETVYSGRATCSVLFHAGVVARAACSPPRPVLF
jgi:hypothetical protein